MELLICDLPCEFCQALLAKLMTEMEYRYKNSFLVADLYAGGGPEKFGDPGKAGGPGKSGDPGRPGDPGKFGDSVVLGVLIGLGILEMLGIQGRLWSWES